MKTLQLKGDKRNNAGKKFTKIERAQGLVPCVIYGGTENQHFTLDKKSFKELVYTPDVYLIDLEVEGKKYSSVLKDIQFHPISDEIIHADFLEIFPHKLIKIGIPVRLIGNSIGVKSGGRLAQKLRKMNVSALPGDLPDFIEINVSKLDIGGTFKVKDVVAEKVTLLDSPNAVIATVQITRAARSAQNG